MKVEKEIWVQATQNLIDRRKSYGHTNDNVHCENPIADYASHLRKVFVGDSVLDVGCGSMALRNCIPPDTSYYGIDAFPVNESVVKGAIEDEETAMCSVETVCAFAVLDNCRDFDKAIENMKKIARKNIVILTGIDIEIDKFHTFKLSLQDFRSRFTDWKETYCEAISPKVYLLEYTK